MAEVIPVITGGHGYVGIRAAFPEYLPVDLYEGGSGGAYHYQRHWRLIHGEFILRKVVDVLSFQIFIPVAAKISLLPCKSM